MPPCVFLSSSVVVAASRSLCVALFVSFNALTPPTPLELTLAGPAVASATRISVVSVSSSLPRSLASHSGSCSSPSSTPPPSHARRLLVILFPFHLRGTLCLAHPFHLLEALCSPSAPFSFYALLASTSPCGGGGGRRQRSCPRAFFCCFLLDSVRSSPRLFIMRCRCRRSARYRLCHTSRAFSITILVDWSAAPCVSVSARDVCMRPLSLSLRQVRFFSISLVVLLWPRVLLVLQLLMWRRWLIRWCAGYSFQRLPSLRSIRKAPFRLRHDSEEESRSSAGLPVSLADTRVCGS